MSRISRSPKASNHLYRKGRYWYWQVFMSSCGLTSGRNRTRKAAIRAARLAILELCNE